MLKTINKHERDDRIKFFEDGHVYEVDGDRSYTSVTTFIHKFFEEFDAKKILKKMRKSTNWPNSPYNGLTDEEIMKQWEDKKNNSAIFGTLLHMEIEKYYNQMENNTENIQKEWEFFQKFHTDFNKIPYRTEWYIFDEDSKLAGSIDMIYTSDNDNLIIVDWKRTIDLKVENRFQKAIHPINHLDDCNYIHYSLQLNTYKYILEKNYGKKIEKMFLVVLHPNNKDYIIKEVSSMQKEISLMIENKPYKKKFLLKNRG